MFFDYGYPDVFNLLIRGDLIEIERKHRAPVRYRNYAKMMFSTNKPPNRQANILAYFREEL